MKFHWGHGILSFIIFFFIATAVFLVWSSRQEFNLVEENYYAKELKYQEVISQKDNTASLTEQVRFEQNAMGIRLHFPQLVRNGKMAGNILVYRPSDPSLDRSFPLSLDTALSQLVPVTQLSKGKYVIKLGWSLDGKDYYQEENVFIP